MVTDHLAYRGSAKFQSPWNIHCIVNISLRSVVMEFQFREG
jgi:hypothetical protein